MHKLLSFLLMTAVILLIVRQVQAARRSEEQCWQGYVFTVGHLSGPAEGATQRIDEAWHTYMTCSRATSFVGLWAQAK